MEQPARMRQLVHMKQPGDVEAEEALVATAARRDAEEVAILAVREDQTVRAW